MIYNLDGNKLISENMLQFLCPSELRKASNRYKLMCCCEYCVQMDYYQNVLNRYRKELVRKIEKDIEKMKTNNKKQRNKKKRNWKQNNIG